MLRRQTDRNVVVSEFTEKSHWYKARVLGRKRNV